MDLGEAAVGVVVADHRVVAAVVAGSVVAGGSSLMDPIHSPRNRPASLASAAAAGRMAQRKPGLSSRSKISATVSFGVC